MKSVGGSSTPEASVYSVNSVGDYSPPEASVNSVNSVGGLAQANSEWFCGRNSEGGVGMAGMPYPPTSVKICEICGRLFSARSFCEFREFCGRTCASKLRVVLWKEFRGRRGYGRDAIPSYENSHGLHGYAQIRRVWHPCHTHAATKLSSHRIHGTHRNDWRRRKICVHL